MKKNSDFSLTGEGITAKVLAAWKSQTKQQNAKIVGEIRDLVGQDAAEALAELSAIGGKADAGTLTTEDLQAFAATIKAGIPRGMARTANRLFYRLAVLSRLMAILNTAVPGGGPIPGGNRVPIVLVPGLPRGQIIVLGNGAVLVGVGNLCRYVVVGRGNVAQCAGMTVGIGPPLPDTQGKRTTSGTLLINAEKAEVHYNVNDNRYTMQAGYRQTLPAGRSWVVAFDRGGSFGQARYKVSQGTYKFTLTDEGWNLFRHTFDVTIDNGENPFEFRYVVDNQHQALPPGRANKHSNIYPLLVRFDNGKGQTKAKRVESGTYEVAVTQENTLDLFTADAVAGPSIAPPQPNASPSSTVAASPTSAPTSAVATTSGTGQSSAGNLFGDQGDWRPSLFVSDVPQIAYFEEPESANM